MPRTPEEEIELLEAWYRGPVWISAQEDQEDLMEMQDNIQIRLDSLYQDEGES